MMLKSQCKVRGIKELNAQHGLHGLRVPLGSLAGLELTDYAPAAYMPGLQASTSTPNQCTTVLTMLQNQKEHGPK